MILQQKFFEKLKASRKASFRLTRLKPIHFQQLHEKTGEINVSNENRTRKHKPKHLYQTTFVLLHDNTGQPHAKVTTESAIWKPIWNNQEDDRTTKWKSQKRTLDFLYFVSFRIYSSIILCYLCCTVVSMTPITIETGFKVVKWPQTVKRMKVEGLKGNWDGKIDQSGRSV